MGLWAFMDMGSPRRGIKSQRAPTRGGQPNDMVCHDPRHSSVGCCGSVGRTVLACLFQKLTLMAVSIGVLHAIYGENQAERLEDGVPRRLW